MRSAKAVNCIVPPLTGNLQSLILSRSLWYFASTTQPIACEQERNRTHKTTLGGMGVSVSQAHAKLNKASWRGEADRRIDYEQSLFFL